MLPLGTDVLELEITPNRPDCLGVYGVAREVHAATGAPLAPAPWSEDPGSLDGEPAGDQRRRRVPGAVPPVHRPRVRGRDDRPLAACGSTARLLAAGMRPISNVVDITNYVMLLTGQPLHAFDLDRVAGGRLTVRRAHDGESVETLDGVARTLDGDMVVICDADGPTSIAAIMGGARSEVHEDTTRVLLEAASWNGANVQRTARARSGCAARPRRASRRASRVGSTLEAQAVATRAAGRAVRRARAAGDDRRRRPRRAAAAAHAAPRRASRRCWAARSRRSAAAEILSSLGFARRCAPGRSQRRRCRTSAAAT